MKRGRGNQASQLPPDNLRGLPPGQQSRRHPSASRIGPSLVAAAPAAALGILVWFALCATEVYDSSPAKPCRQQNTLSRQPSDQVHHTNIRSDRVCKERCTFWSNHGAGHGLQMVMSICILYATVLVMPDSTLFGTGVTLTESLSPSHQRPRQSACRLTG